MAGSPVSKTRPTRWAPSWFSPLRIWSASHRQLNDLKRVETAQGVSLGRRRQGAQVKAGGTNAARRELTAAPPPSWGVPLRCSPGPRDCPAALRALPRAQLPGAAPGEQTQLHVSGVG